MESNLQPELLFQSTLGQTMMFNVKSVDQSDKPTENWVES